MGRSKIKKFKKFKKYFLNFLNFLIFDLAPYYRAWPLSYDRYATVWLTTRIYRVISNKSFIQLAYRTGLGHFLIISYYLCIHTLRPKTSMSGSKYNLFIHPLVSGGGISTDGLLDVDPAHS